MALLITVLFFGAIAVPLVECGCSSFLKASSNMRDSCLKWYREALDNYESSGTRAECLLLVKEKCPYMIDIVTSLSKRFDGTSEYLITDGQATSTDGSFKFMTFYMKKTKPVCSEDVLLPFDCDYWWTVATHEHAKDKYKRLCIDQMSKNCGSRIAKTQEEPCDDQGCLGGKSQTVTYQYRGHTVSIKYSV